MGIKTNKNQDQITGITVMLPDGSNQEMNADYYFSCMPICDLISSFDTAPDRIREISAGLLYRDYIIVGLLLKKMSIKDEKSGSSNQSLPDNWIYIQEKNIKMGRLDIFNNFSADMVGNKQDAWLGAEYFCNHGDTIWQKTDKELAEFAIGELMDMGLAEEQDLLDHVVIRQKKAYPAYFGSYNKFPIIKDCHIFRDHGIADMGPGKCCNRGSNISTGIQIGSRFLQVSDNFFSKSFRICGWQDGTRLSLLNKHFHGICRR